jgi:hypothetical protein
MGTGGRKATLCPLSFNAVQFNVVAAISHQSQDAFWSWTFRALPAGMPSTKPRAHQIWGRVLWEPDHSTHQFYKLFANRESETCQIRTYFKRRPDHPIDRRRRAR